MRMTIIDKFLLVLVLLFLLALSFLLGAVALSLVPLEGAVMFLQALQPVWSVNQWIIGGIALLVFLVAVRLLAASYGAGKGTPYTRLKTSENGEIAISIATLKQIVASYLATKPEVTASSSAVLEGKSGLLVRLRLCVKEGVALPELTTGIQTELKSHLETITGLTVHQIGILVDTNKPAGAGKGR